MVLCAAGVQHHAAGLIYWLATHDGVAQCAELIDADMHHVSGLQRKGRIGNERGAGTENHAAGKFILAEEVRDEFIEAAVQFMRTGLALPVYPSSALDMHADREVVGILELPGRRDAGAERAGAGVDLCMGQLERVLALDAART